MRVGGVAYRAGTGDYLIKIAPAVPGLVLAIIALPLHYSADFGRAYQSGAQAWSDGLPQNFSTWTGTPLLAMAMALISRTAGELVAARIFMAFDLALWMALLVIVWPRLEGHVSKAWWWTTLLAAGLFAPAVSTIFWLQFNLVVFALALAAFVLIGRHDRWAGVLLGLSLALKPIVILLPIALLLRPRLRGAGAPAVLKSSIQSPTWPAS